MTRLFVWEEVPGAHHLLYDNGIYESVSARVGARRPSLKSLEETRAAIPNG
jgi:hypothetical protein